MQPIVFLILRRMRAPLLLLIGVYAIAMLGLVLIPGVDDNGQPWRMDFLHAFYFVSYMATTIGFGEIPYALTPGQRLWVTFCIYLTVIAWLYAIGKILGLLQDPAFRHVQQQRQFQLAVRKVRDPFYLICGYGDTGSNLLNAFIAQGHACVVIDSDPERINALQLIDMPRHVPGLIGDAGLPDNLLMAGLANRNCAGVIAITDNDDINLHIAITSKLLQPGVKVICRAESTETADNMASFNTDYIVNPFESFASRLTMAIDNPCLYVLHSWLTGCRPLSERLDPPRGEWLICGFGRFGQALHRRLTEVGIKTTIIESTPENTPIPDGDTRLIKGWGTEAHTLQHAGITDAAGIIAGTDHDTNNLSILMTAGMLNPDLFMVVRQNRQQNAKLFETVYADLVAQSATTMADRIHTLLNRPMLTDFFRETKQHGDDYARHLVARLGGVLGEQNPEIWQLTLTEETAPAVIETLEEEAVHIIDLVTNNRDRKRPATTIALLLQRGKHFTLMPPGDTKLETDDKLLFAGPRNASTWQQATLHDATTLMYTRKGITRDPRAFWQRLLN